MANGQTVGERETTVPAAPLVIVTVGMAVDHVPDTVLDALEEDLEVTAANVSCGSESGDDDAPLVRHGRSSDNIFHPEIEASVEQIQMTAVDVEGMSQDLMRDDGVQGEEVGVSPPLPPRGS